MYLPWLRSGLFLCRLIAAESLAQSVYAGYSETLVFRVLVCIARILLLAGAAMITCISYSWQARSRLIVKIEVSQVVETCFHASRGLQVLLTMFYNKIYWCT